MHNLALTLRAQGELDKARELQERVLDGLGQVLGVQHPDTLTAMRNLAETLRVQGELDAARERGDSLHSSGLASARSKRRGDLTRIVQ